ncbi:interactor of constitutive active ROPs 4-like [Cornus florida]|uniref:interactor of constitutive active ROPs 4-like n=1 Tax=Cornus florida TaxID=4283 RepID=UPI00289BAB62|nr:interactor of constitutive active ROPs 4-like [Cornus florida]XP_059662806.1 interactor of constitutive active ROPs 4-like [Cornus florida]XP_059662807.1 interactor of constitutive active ROPs 4-like [Cornus florida]
MPRSRGSEMPQRQSPRVPLQLRTSTSSNSDPLQRPVAGRSPKLGDHRSPRSVQSSTSVNQKKLGSRLSVLESQLGNAQEELKILKEQLASAEAAKKEAQEKLKKTQDPLEIEEKRPPSIEIQESNKEDNSVPYEIIDVNQQETDVFEVPLEKVTMESIAKLDQPTSEEDFESKPVSISTESPAIPEPEKPSFVDLALKDDDINSLKANLEDKEKELEVFCQENESLKRQLSEASLEMTSARAKEEEMTIRLTQLEQQLGESKATAVVLTEKLETVEGANEALEAEMKKMRVQTEQWRKAADAAATVLAGGVELNGKRISDRCGSMDKHFSSMFEIPVGGYAGFMGSPSQADDSDDGYGSGKRKGSGIRMFGDLWRKKGQK